MKNFISKKMFNTCYNDLPLASEIIVDLKLKALKWKLLSISIIAVIVMTVVIEVMLL